MGSDREAHRTAILFLSEADLAPSPAGPFLRSPCPRTPLGDAASWLYRNPAPAPASKGLGARKIGQSREQLALARVLIAFVL